MRRGQEIKFNHVFYVQILRMLFGHLLNDNFLLQLSESLEISYKSGPECETHWLPRNENSEENVSKLLPL